MINQTIYTNSLDLETLKRWMVQQLAPVIHLPHDQVDTSASFLALGLDSVAAVGLTADLEAFLGRTIPPTVVADYPTIDELAGFLIDSGMTATVSPSIEPAKPASPEARPTPPWFKDLAKRGERLREAGDLFEPVLTDVDGCWANVNGRRLLLLSSYSYLGLNGHPRINAAAKKATETIGTGLHAARLIGGTTEIHRDLERTLASFKRTEDALLFSTGYMTNIMTIVSLTSEGDWVIGDAFNHACLVDGGAFSNAKFVTFAHSNMQALETQLQRAGSARKMVVVDGVFSMDGDIAPLPQIVDLCRRYGALLMVDEAHSIGVLGRTGRGVTEHFGLDSTDVDIHMGTLSKSFPSMGGYVAGSRELVAALKYSARGWIFSSSMPAPLIAAAKAAIEVLIDEPQRVERLWTILRRYVDGLRGQGFPVENAQTPIVPIMCKEDRQAFELASGLREEGILVYPIVYPAVPANQPRVRTTVTAAMSDEEVDIAVAALGRVGRRVGLTTI